MSLSLDESDLNDLKQKCTERFIEYAQADGGLKAHSEQWRLLLGMYENFCRMLGMNNKTEPRIEIDSRSFFSKFDLSECNLTLPIVFIRCTFHEELDMSGSVFEESLQIIECTINNAFALQTCKFKSKSKFINVVNTIEIYLNTCQFDDDAEFKLCCKGIFVENSHFLGKLEIHGSAQSKSLNIMVGATNRFDGMVLLRSLTCKFLQMDGVHLKGGLDIQNCYFEDATFYRIICDSSVWISPDSFAGNVDFDSSTFNGDIVFTHSKNGQNLTGRVGLTSCIFYGAVSAGGMEFFASIDFEYSVFKNPVDLHGSVFHDEISFEAVIADQRIKLEDCSFSKLPDFREAKLAQPILFNRIWPDKRKFRDLVARQPKSKLTTDYLDSLARIAAQSGDFEWQQEFVAQGIRAARGTRNFPWPIIHRDVSANDAASQNAPETEMAPKRRIEWPGGWNYWLGLLFELISDFGRSIWRPLLALIVVMGLSALTLSGFAEKFYQPKGGLPSECLSAPYEEATFVAIKSGLLMFDTGADIKNFFTCSEATAEPFMNPKAFFALVVYTEKFLAGILLILIGMATRFNLRVR